jgi:hypothetical protein
MNSPLEAFYTSLVIAFVVQELDRLFTTAKRNSKRKESSK